MQRLVSQPWCSTHQAKNVTNPNLEQQASDAYRANFNTKRDIPYFGSSDGHAGVRNTIG